MLAMVKDGLAIFREGMILGVLGLFVLAPQLVGERLAKAGFTKLSVGGLELNLGQFNREVAALNAVERARELVAAPGIQASPDVEAARAQLDVSARELRVSVANSAAAVAAVAPSGALPQSGWMFLGTLYPDRDEWRPDTGDWRTTRTVQQPYDQIRPGQRLSVRTAVNLRDGPGRPDGTAGTVLTALRPGQQVIVRDLAAPFTVPTTAPDAPGRRVWSRVEIAPASGG